MSGCQSRYR